jgi:hypothetical protein
MKVVYQYKDLRTSATSLKMGQCFTFASNNEIYMRISDKGYSHPIGKILCVHLVSGNTALVLGGEKVTPIVAELHIYKEEQED